jgi:DNA mismatch endonuclease (patch repair protein)
MGMNIARIFECPSHDAPFGKKIEGNIARDAVNEMKLRKLGWHVVTVWECDLHNSIAKKHLMKRLPALLKN